MSDKQLCVRSVKLKGVYSECLIMSPESLGLDPSKLKEGQDLQDILGIFKYEPPVKQIQLASGRKIKYQSNPNFHVYYKFPNLKNVQGMFNEEDNVQITCKIHGTNARYGIVKKTKLTFVDKFKKFFKLADKWIDYEFVVGSHNVEKGSDSQGFYETNVWYEIADKYNLKDKLWNYVKVRSSLETINTGLVVYGEIYGPGIQKNYDYGLKELEFAVFDITWNNEYDNQNSIHHITENVLRLKHVPILYTGPWSQEIQDKYVFNNMIEGTKVPHEGIVVKHVSGDRRKVAKVINPDYLIYSEKHNVGDSH